MSLLEESIGIGIRSVTGHEVKKELDSGFDPSGTLAGTIAGTLADKLIGKAWSAATREIAIELGASKTMELASVNIVRLIPNLVTFEVVYHILKSVPTNEGETDFVKNKIRELQQDMLDHGKFTPSEAPSRFPNGFPSNRSDSTPSAQVDGGSGDYMSKVGYTTPSYQNLLDPQQRAELARQETFAPVTTTPSNKIDNPISPPIPVTDPSVDHYRNSPNNNDDHFSYTVIAPQQPNPGDIATGGYGTGGGGGGGGDHPSSYTANTGWGDDSPSEHRNSTSSDTKTSRETSVSGETNGGRENPVILDLDGNGVKINPLSSSMQTFDMAGDGQQHLTAWAGKGDGVLAIDANGDGKIDRREEIVFTAWDSSAKTDFDALRSVFDNIAFASEVGTGSREANASIKNFHDGKLTAADERFSQFRVMVDGQVMTLAQLGIIEINLVSNRTQFVFTDGSQINGTATFTRVVNGVTQTLTAADTTLVYDKDGGTVSTTVTTNANGSTTTRIELRDAAGKITSTRTKTTSANGLSDTILFDDDGDGVTDRKQAVTRATNRTTGDMIETVSEFDKDGRKIASSQTVYKQDGSIKKLSVDRDGDGKFETREDITLNASTGEIITKFSNLNPNGSVAFSTTQTVSRDSLTKTLNTDADGNGRYETRYKDVITPAATGSRSETETLRSYSGKLLNQRVTSTSADGQTKTIQTDSDGCVAFASEVGTGSREANAIIKYANTNVMQKFRCAA